MTDHAAEQLRATADMVDEARGGIEHGDLELDEEELSYLVERVDTSLSEIEDVLRQIAILEEIADRDRR